MKSLLCRTIVSLAIFAGCSNAHAQPLRILDVHGHDQLGASLFTSIISHEVNFGNYERVEEALTYYAKTKERIDDGRWILSFVRLGIENSASVPNFDVALSRIEAWKKKVPDSTGAAIYESAYWYRYAWNARGGGYAPSVTDIGWKLFRERLQKAEAALAGSKNYASANPEWYALYLRCALGLDWTLEERLRLFAEAIKQEPYYYDTYFTMVRGLSPKWGGDYALVAKLAEEAVRATQKEEGTSMYARIYWSLSQSENLDRDIFRDAGASWPRMKKGFEELQARYPDAHWNLNNFASFACRARDKETFLKLLPTVRKFHDAAAWRSNYSLDVCTHMFTEAS